MALEYTSMFSSDMLLSDIEAHVEWFGQLMRQSFFFDKENSNTRNLALPSALVSWYKRQDFDEETDENGADKLYLLHRELGQEAQKLITHVTEGKSVSVELYDSVEYRFLAYVNYVRRLEQHMSGLSIAIDPATGLRSMSGLQSDVKRELDRRERKGDPFCLSNIQIDNMDELIRDFDREALDHIYLTIGKALTKTVRTFDDAYHLGKGEFILCLKHVDLLDACAVMDRMCSYIAADIIMSIEGQFEPLKFTASFGVVEPVPGDDVDTVFNHVKRARQEAQAEGGNQVVQWKERSSLEDYANEVTSFD